jgi:thioesterase domain-containing protein/acyl carrier protein
LANSHIGLDDDFFALGGHSLLAVDMMLQIEKETHIRLPLASLFKYPTIRALSQIIAKGGKEEDAWSSLVPIKTSGSMNPLFIIHGAGLNIFLFNTLANHMDADQPVYGLQAKGLNGTDQPLKTVFDMAAYYVSEIRKVKPTGPYNLAGFSLGGIIAFEMALQLIESGDSVSFLGLFDTVAFTSKHYFSQYKRIKRSLIELGGVPFFNCRQFCKNPKRTWYDKSKKYRDQLLRLYWTLKGDKVSVTKEGLPLYALNVRRASDQAAENYQLGYFPGTIDLFRALGRSFFVHDPKYLDWEQHCRAVETHDIPGDHSKIFAPPNDAYFAVCLQKRLRQLEETSQTN